MHIFFGIIDLFSSYFNITTSFLRIDIMTKQS